jgi:ubiquinone biosynthesis protein UbiJ
MVSFQANYAYEEIKALKKRVEQLEKLVERLYHKND